MIRQVDVKILNKDPLGDIQRAAYNTIGREWVKGKPMGETLIKKYLISEHTPIRVVNIEITLTDILYYTSVYFTRHNHSLDFVRTSRTDRTGRERSIDDRVNHIIVANPQSIIDIARKRLCRGKCHDDMYKWMVAIKDALVNSEYALLTVLGSILAPNCDYRGFCPEFTSCKYKK